MAAAVLLTPARVMAWGGVGHSTIAYIASRNLTPEAREQIEKRYNRSIEYYASMMDYHRKDSKAMDNCSHLLHIDATTMKPVGKPLRQMKQYIELLKDWENQNDSVREVAMMCLVHFMGDYHCPGHHRFMDHTHKNITIHYTNYKVKVLNEKTGTSYHKFWDGGVFAANYPGLFYSDLQRMFDCIPQSRKDELTKGTLEEWFEESARTCLCIYQLTPKAPKGATDDELPVIDRRLCNQYGELMALQIEKAGLRLAKVLNDVFGNMK